KRELPFGEQPAGAQVEPQIAVAGHERPRQEGQDHDQQRRQDGPEPPARAGRGRRCWAEWRKGNRRLFGGGGCLGISPHRLSSPDRPLFAPGLSGTGPGPFPFSSLILRSALLPANVSLFPSGQTTSMLSTRSAAPSPKWARTSPEHR